MFDITPKNLSETAEKHPENLIFYPVDILARGLRKGQGLRAAVVAELFVRYFLSANPEIKAMIGQELPDRELDDFMALFPGQYLSRESLNRDLWVAQNEFSRCCLAAVRKRFLRLCTADGLIPVYWTGAGAQAFLIPFSLADDIPDGGVVDLQGQNIPEWSAAVARLEIASTLRIHCSCNGMAQLTGDSLMLPVQLAWWRKQKLLAQNNVFQLIATGAFDENLRLAPVAVAEKAQALSKLMQPFTFLFPDSPRNNPAGPGMKILPAGLSREELLPVVQKIAEHMTRLDPEYALRRLTGMSEEVRLTHYTDWENLVRRLENAAAFDLRKFPEQYLLNLMLQSAANCHGGHTEKADKLNERARNFADQHGDRYVRMLLQLDIERLVLLLDQEEFAGAATLAQPLMDRLEALQDKDLLMRCHGTLGQTHACATLANIPGFSQDEAKAHFMRAADFAYELGDAAEIAHDLNYIHLFHAIFAPGSDDEQVAYEQAYSHIFQLKSHHEEKFWKNLYYLKRSRALAWYRQLLTTGTVPPYAIDAEFERLLHPRHGAEDWIRACVGKCLGALAAAQGRRKTAEQLFAHAAEALATETLPRVKAIIRLTVHAEAWRSLGQDQYRQQACQILADNTLFAKFPTARRFQDFLLHTATFPGLQYWY